MNNKAMSLLWATAVIFGPTTSALSITIHVPADQPTIQAAIDAANGGDEVIVAPGTYLETIDFSFKAITVRSSGGAAITMIDAQGLGSVVTCQSGEGPSTVLEGFTLTGGDPSPASGGGMYNLSSSPTVTDCIFTANTANYGGGMFNVNSSPTITNCIFSDNTALSGGAMYNVNSQPTLTNCTFSANSAAGIPNGGAGGAIRNESFSSLTLNNCSFSGNTCNCGGCAIYNANSDLFVLDCTFSGNPGGPTVGLSDGGIVTLTNCTFSGNTGPGWTVGTWDTATVTLTNCTFSSNLADWTVGASDTGNLTLTNCVLWNNSGENIFGTPSVNFCNVEGGFAGTGNLDVDPQFVDELGPDGIPGTGDEDLRLAADSWCIDAGDSAAVPLGVLADLDGNLRFVDAVNYPDFGNPDGVNPVVDMGALEAAAGTTASPRAYVKWRHATSGDNVIWMTNAAAISPAPLNPVGNTSWTVVGMGDFNGDGEPYDILWRHLGNGNNSLWFMYGTSTLPESGPVQPVADTNWAVVGTDDFDGDGRCDILWRHRDTGENLMWLMDGTTILPGSGPLPQLANRRWTVAGTGDFNGDGRSDILWRHTARGKNSMWFTDGTTVLPESGPLPTVSNKKMRVVGTGDFDGDGRSDILWRNRRSGKNSMWLMDGTTVLPESGPLPDVANTKWVVVGTRDFDGDGRCDILWHHQVNANNSRWLMDGTTVLPGTGPVRSFGDPNWAAVATSD
jgi:hypothetical protein